MVPHCGLMTNAITTMWVKLSLKTTIVGHSHDGGVGRFLHGSLKID
jgi:hypothetical protein